MRLLPFIAGSIISLAASGGDDGPVQAPYIEVGDCWSYRGTRLFHHGWINEYKECITYIDRDKNVVLALVTVKDDGREIETSYSLEWADRTTIYGHYYEPAAAFLRFPLKVGDSYTASFTVIDTQARTPGRVAAEWEMKVIGWEDIAVPAGKFRALRIEGRWTQEVQGRYVPFAHTIWYAPGVRRAVKWSYSAYASGLTNQGAPERFGAELLTYELNK